MKNYPLVLNALIVLGHDGWLNASVWESDVISSEKMRAVLYIQKPDDELTPPFERKFRARNNTCEIIIMKNLLTRTNLIKIVK